MVKEMQTVEGIVLQEKSSEHILVLWRQVSWYYSTLKHQVDTRVYVLECARPRLLPAWQNEAMLLELQKYQWNPYKYTFPISNDKLKNKMKISLSTVNERSV